VLVLGAEEPTVPLIIPFKAQLHAGLILDNYLIVIRIIIH